MTSSTDSAREFLKAYLAQNRRSLTASQIRILSMVIRAQATKEMGITHLADVMLATLDLSVTDEKPIYQIGPASAAYVLSVISSRSQT